MSVRVHGRLASDFGANLAATGSGILTAVVARQKMPLIDEKLDSEPYHGRWIPYQGGMSDVA